MAIGTVQLGITIYFAAAGLLEDHPQLVRGRLEHARLRADEGQPASSALDVDDSQCGNCE